VAKLKNVKPSKNFADETWIPEKYKKLEIDFNDPFAPYGRITQLPVESYNSILTNPNNYLQLDYYDRKMLDSGATIQEILFMRALNRARENGDRSLLEKRR